MGQVAGPSPTSQIALPQVETGMQSMEQVAGVSVPLHRASPQNVEGIQSIGQVAGPSLASQIALPQVETGMQSMEQVAGVSVPLHRASPQNVAGIQSAGQIAGPSLASQIALPQVDAGGARVAAAGADMAGIEGAMLEELLIGGGGIAGIKKEELELLIGGGGIAGIKNKELEELLIGGGGIMGGIITPSACDSLRKTKTVARRMNAKNKQTTTVCFFFSTVFVSILICV